jgi:hypothetical protein
MLPEHHRPEEIVTLLPSEQEVEQGYPPVGRVLMWRYQPVDHVAVQEYLLMVEAGALVSKTKWNLEQVLLKVATEEAPEFQLSWRKGLLLA